MTSKPKPNGPGDLSSNNEAGDSISLGGQSSFEDESGRSKEMHSRRMQQDNNNGDTGFSKDSDYEDYFIGDSDGGSEDDGSADGAIAEAVDAKKKGARPLTEKEILKARDKEAKSGVVYMSRVPPFMKPVKVRHLLKKYADIGRVYFIEEDEQKRKRRIKNGGNRRRLFVEGWIEFANKKYAKAVTQMLNNTQMGGKKHGFYHDDLWNLKYLPKFKWRHLVDQLASEQAAKQQRLQSEISQSRRELDMYMKNVDQAKKMASIASKREAKIKRGENVKQFEDISRNVWQRDVVKRDERSGTDDGDTVPVGKRRRTQQKSDITSVLDQIF